LFALVVTLVTVAACSNSRDSAPTTSAAPPTTSEPPTTTAASTTTDAPTTTRAPTTTASTTSTTTTTTQSPTTTSVAPTSAVVVPPTVPLRTDGFSAVAFGTDAETAIAAFTAELGAPSEDTGWVEPLAISTCGGTQARRLSWGALSMLFGDQSPYVQGSPHFLGWSYGTVDGIGAEPIGLVTDQDIGLGDTVAGLRAAYPGVTVTPGEEGLIETTFSIDGSLGGLLTGDTDGDSVTVLSAGPYCG
jgi:hypothetical protein